MSNFTNPEPMECNPVGNILGNPEKIYDAIIDHVKNYATAKIDHNNAEFDDDFDDEEFDRIYRTNNNIASQESTPGSQHSFATGSFNDHDFDTVIGSTQAQESREASSVFRRIDSNESSEKRFEERQDPCCKKYERIIVMDEFEGPYEGTPPCEFHESYYKRWLSSIKARREGKKEKEEKKGGQAEPKRFAPYWNYDPKKYENKTVELPKARVIKDYIDE
ncbi:Oidioi.mRNA.OKI2018_I69.PAR.g11994.t1.cds [Oikopleura dioica]|uniref:Oidioi.mRNA.OKI2018_I69.PAR.g11994.t1.cds n=1 Tax=Oikopleura dioica TaxID=34765 RepID=A0ABN7S1F0_OIKDI|nr:Oidioi.mRNA.OKI2018_I69.PAR.g11994.t1.cds [Oikopleura dioica]